MTTFVARDFVPLPEAMFASLLEGRFKLAEAPAENLYASLLFTSETTRSHRSEYCPPSLAEAASVNSPDITAECARGTPSRLEGDGWSHL